MWQKGAFDLAVAADIQSLWAMYRWLEDVSPLARYGGSFLLVLHVLVTTTWAKVQSCEVWRERTFVVAQRSLFLLGALLVGAPFTFSAGSVLAMRADRYELATLCILLAKVIPSWDNFKWQHLVEFFFPTVTRSVWWKLADFCYSLI